MDLYAKLSANMEELAGTFDSRMHHYEVDLKKLSSTDQASHKDLAALTCEFTDFKTLMWKTLAMMRSQLELLVQGLDRQETASRRKVLLFHGMAESNDAAVVEPIIKLLTDQFKMSDISAEDLSACHRLGTNTGKLRPVMVRFESFKIRSLVWNAKTALKNSGITVSEFLTKPRHEVFIAARKHFGIKQCWTSEGKIVILLPDNKRRRIETVSELKPLLSEHPAVLSGPEKKAPGTSQVKGKSSTLPAVKSGKAEPRPRRAVK